MRVLLGLIFEVFLHQTEEMDLIYPSAILVDQKIRVGIYEGTDSSSDPDPSTCLNKSSL